MGFQSTAPRDDILDAARVGVDVAFRRIRALEHPDSDFDDNERFLWHYALILMDKTRQQKNDVSFGNFCAALGTSRAEYETAMRDVARSALMYQWDTYERMHEQDFFMQGGFARFAYAAHNTGLDEPEEVADVLDIPDQRLEGFGLKAGWYEAREGKVLSDNDFSRAARPLSPEDGVLKFWSFERATDMEDRLVEFGKPASNVIGWTQRPGYLM